MCDGTLLPHCGHLFSCEACQRFAAFRVRNRIFDVLRFGTPMAGAYQSIIRWNYNQRMRDSLNRQPAKSGPLQRFNSSRFNDLASVYPRRSNPISASRPALPF
jgi:hypothetical protein